MTLRPLVACALLLLPLACAPKRIPGTEIRDDEETRAILNVMELYRRALEARDAKAIQGLVDRNFRDNAGTETPEDDLTYESLMRELPARLAKFEDVKLEFTVKRIEVEGATAQAVYFWNARYRMPKLNNKPQLDSELEVMVFQRTGEGWKILSGI
ncbi:MAG TPA: nuclear transport factor 2 family protein [Aggregicoccus sp.]|nr:nuclear transport factor 2 family protein [Aggregicoccus sp.]